jgi:hypothetical protein
MAGATCSSGNAAASSPACAKLVRIMLVLGREAGGLRPYGYLALTVVHMGSVVGTKKNGQKNQEK